MPFNVGCTIFFAIKLMRLWLLLICTSNQHLNSDTTENSKILSIEPTEKIVQPLLVTRPAGILDTLSCDSCFGVRSFGWRGGSKSSVHHGAWRRNHALLIMQKCVQMVHNFYKILSNFAMISCTYDLRILENVWK